MVILCMDANFRLKNQIVSNYSQDPGLGTGWAYMVPRKEYEAYVLSRANEKDVRGGDSLISIFADLRPTDQHLCGISSFGKSQHEIFSGFEVHGSQCSGLWAFGNGYASGHWELAERGEVCRLSARNVIFIVSNLFHFRVDMPTWTMYLGWSYEQSPSAWS